MKEILDLIARKKREDYNNYRYEEKGRNEEKDIKAEFLEGLSVLGQLSLSLFITNFIGLRKRFFERRK